MAPYSVFMIRIYLLSIMLTTLVHAKKLVILTGANSGVGLSAAKLLTEKGDYQVIFACRSKDKALKAIKSLDKANQQNAEFAHLDVSDLNSVRSFCDTFKASKRPLYCLALNAGIQVGGSSKLPIFSPQGYENTIATNHLGHFLMIQQLLPLLKKTGSRTYPSRIVFTASGVHNPEEGGGNVGSKAALNSLDGFKNGFKTPICMVDGGSYESDKAYKDSKLLNVITTLETAKRELKSLSITVNCFNPGLVPTTGLFRAFSPLFLVPFTFLTRFIFKVAVDEKEAGQRLFYMLTAPELLGRTGQYYSGKPGKAEFEAITPSVEARDENKAKLVWQLSEKLVLAK